MEDRIRELAYLKWEAAGRPPGDGVDFWHEAETEVHLERARSRRVTGASGADQTATKIAAKTTKGGTR